MEKIDGNRLELFSMVIVSFSIDNKDKTSQFLEETFLLTDISKYFSFEILFLIMHIVKINFIDCELK